MLVVVFSEIAEGNVTPAAATGIASLIAWASEDGSGANFDDRSHAAGHFELLASASSQIEWDCAGDGGTGVTEGDIDISTFGWIDHRGRGA
jgi:hypothetical protein